MTPKEIKDLIAAKIARQGSMVDVGGGLATILNEIVDKIGGGGSGNVIEVDWDYSQWDFENGHYIHNFASLEEAGLVGVNESSTICHTTAFDTGDIGVHIVHPSYKTIYKEGDILVNELRFNSYEEMLDAANHWFEIVVMQAQDSEGVSLGVKVAVEIPTMG